MTGRPIIWVVVHDLDRTGVPVSFTRLATDAGLAAAVELHVVAGRDGPLRTTLSRQGVPVTVLEPAHGRSIPGLASAGIRQTGAWEVAERFDRVRARARTHRLPAPRAIVAYGAGAWPLASSLHTMHRTARLVVHLHELASGLRRSLSPDQQRSLAATADRVLSVTEAVDHLVRDLGVDTDRRRIVAGSTDEPPRGWNAPIPQPADREIVSIGAAGWRKGTDQAIAAAWELERRGRPVRWRWVGQPPADGWEFAVDARLPLHWVGPTADPWATVDALASGPPPVLVIPSREDPLPLVALEAGARGIPVVATSTGGLTDLLADGRGYLVTPGRPAEIADAVAAVLDDPTHAAAAAAALRAHVHKHHRTAVVATAWRAAVLGRD